MAYHHRRQGLAESQATALGEGLVGSAHSQAAVHNPEDTPGKPPGSCGGKRSVSEGPDQQHPGRASSGSGSDGGTEIAESRVAYRQWRNTCLRKYRAEQQQLIRQLDQALPPSCRSSCSKNVGSSRGLGISGRSLLLVLEDTRKYLRGLRDAGLLPVGPPATKVEPQAHAAAQAAAALMSQSPAPPPLVDAAMRREALIAALMVSMFSFVLEIESISTWTITATGRGAAEFFRDAPFESICGQSLANLMRCEDARKLPQLSSSSSVSLLQASDAKFHLADFSATIESGVSQIDAVFTRDPLEWDPGVDIRDSDGSQRHLRRTSSWSRTASSFSRTDSWGSNEAIVTSQYMPIMVQQIIPLDDSEDALSGRALLVASFDKSTFFPRCSACGKACGFRAKETRAAGPSG